MSSVPRSVITVTRSCGWTFEADADGIARARGEYQTSMIESFMSLTATPCAGLHSSHVLQT